jgi:hypothetical protein
VGVADAIPTSPQEIDAIWLTRVLQRQHPGCEARAVTIVDAHSGTTGRARLRVDWEQAAGAPSALFAKLTPTDPAQREMVISTGMGRREARFYAELAAEMPVLVAAPVHSLWNEDGSAYLMLMEDLAARGSRFPHWTDAGVPDYADSMMEELARLHSHFQDSARFESDLNWVDPPMRSEWGPLLVNAAVEQFGDDMPAAFHEMARIYIDHTDAVNDRLDAGPHTLIHGDSHLGNLFVDGSRVGYLDWACFCHAPGIRDVAYFTASSLPTELRRNREETLLRRYLDSLDRAPSFEDAWQQYRLFTLCSWVAATVTAGAGSRMQPLEVGLRSMQRATDALIDLETLELFRGDLEIR